MTWGVTRREHRHRDRRGRAGRHRSRSAVLAERTADLPARTRTWRTLLVRAVVAADLGVVLAVSAAAIALGVGTRSWDLSTAAAYSCIGAGVALTLMAAMRCWDAQVIGQGTEEFNRLVRAFIGASLVLALIGFMVKAEGLRPWVVGVLPATGAGILAGRYLIRRVLHAARRENVCMASVLVVGTEDGVADLVARTRRVPHHGWDVVAACTSTGPVDGHAEIDGVPVVGDLDEIAHHVAEFGIDVVAVSPTPGLVAAPAAGPGLAARGHRGGPRRRPGPHGDRRPAPARRPGRRHPDAAAHRAPLRRRDPRGQGRHRPRRRRRRCSSSSPRSS